MFSMFFLRELQIGLQTTQRDNNSKPEHDLIPIPYLVHIHNYIIHLCNQ